ncbi:uncharacterized protein [Euphorbia lathyris]|uniref:uncharacterized protein n=1 Tax=Euphorbia lathyris TaxID=212925 RepID=UPI00331388DC
MASNLVKFHIQSFKPTNPPIGFLKHNSLFSHLPFPKIKLQTLTFTPSHKHFQNHIIPSLYIHSSTPPSSKEEAILQAKTCLSTTLEKPLNNPKLTGKLKKLRQPRFRLEIPVIDDSPTSLSQLALDVFKGISIKRRGSKVKFLILWPNPISKNTAVELFQSHSSNNVEHVDLSSIENIDERSLGSAEVAVFIGAEMSQLETIKTITEAVYPKPAVIFNPKWGYEEESEFGEVEGRFVGTFEVIYSFMGLEVRGVLSKRKGVVFKCVRDGVVSGEKWGIHVEEEGGKLELVSKFKDRPSIVEVENVLYNLMAINSPITKSAKFFRGLVSTVTGKK